VVPLLAKMTIGVTDNRKAAGRDGGVEAVIAVLTRVDDADSLLEQACKTLANMTDGDAYNRKAVGRSGGVEAVIIVAVLRRGSAADSLQWHARSALDKCISHSGNLATARRLLCVDASAVLLTKKELMNNSLNTPLSCDPWSVNTLLITS
jgi:hypothetical protein